MFFVCFVFFLFAIFFFPPKYHPVWPAGMATAAIANFTPPSQAFPADLRHDLPSYDLLWEHGERVSRLMMKTALTLPPMHELFPQIQ